MKIKKLLKPKKSKRQKLSSGIKLKGLQAKIRQRPRAAAKLLKAADAEHPH